jgi:hypothetical protein
MVLSAWRVSAERGDRYPRSRFSGFPGLWPSKSERAAPVS